MSNTKNQGRGVVLTDSWTVLTWKSCGRTYTWSGPSKEAWARIQTLKGMGIAYTAQPIVAPR